LKSTDYLYGEEVPQGIPQEVIQDRIHKLDLNLTKLLKVDFLNRDEMRVNAILKAKTFWENINRR
jgi:hypothetical protein